MTLSNAVMFAIIVASGATLGAEGATTINSAADAAKALEPVAGSLAAVVFALGFIGSGFLAVPVLAGSGSSAMAGLLDKRWGFSRSPRKAPIFYGLVVVATITATALEPAARESDLAARRRSCHQRCPCGSVRCDRDVDRERRAHHGRSPQWSPRADARLAHLRVDGSSGGRAARDPASGPEIDKGGHWSARPFVPDSRSLSVLEKAALACDRDPPSHSR